MAISFSIKTRAGTHTGVADAIAMHKSQIVVFDTHGTTGTGLTADQSFEQIKYKWDFGAGAIASYANGYQVALSDFSKLRGPNVAAVFDADSTVTCTATDPSGATAVYTFTITAAAYAWEKYVDATLGSDGGTGDIGDPWATLAFARTQLRASTGSPNGRAIYLKRGETFNVLSEGTQSNKVGPYLVGAYGSGAKPIINTTDQSGKAFNHDTNTSTHLTVRDCSFTTDSGGGSIGVIGFGANNFLVLSCDFESMSAITNISNRATTDWGIVDCKMTGARQYYALFDNADHAADDLGARHCLMANDFTDTSYDAAGGSAWSLIRGVFHHAAILCNHFRRFDDADVGTNGETIKFLGDQTDGDLAGTNPAQHSHVFGNYFEISDTRQNALFKIQGGYFDKYIFCSNVIHHNHAADNNANWTNYAGNCLWRNNIGVNFTTFINPNKNNHVGDRLVHNTFYSDWNLTGITVYNGAAENLTALLGKSNVVIVPNEDSAGHFMSTNLGGAETTLEHNILDVKSMNFAFMPPDSPSIIDNPVDWTPNATNLGGQSDDTENIDPELTNLTTVESTWDFSPASAGSNVVGAGAVTPYAPYDYFGTDRPLTGSWDLGAIQYDAGGPPTPTTWTNEYIGQASVFATWLNEYLGQATVDANTWTNEYVGSAPVLTGSPLEIAMHRAMQRAAFVPGSVMGQAIIYKPKDGSVQRIVYGSWHPSEVIPLDVDTYSADAYDGLLHVDYEVVTAPQAGDQYIIDGETYQALEPGHMQQGTLRLELHRLDNVRRYASPISEPR